MFPSELKCTASIIPATNQRLVLSLQCYFLVACVSQIPLCCWHVPQSFHQTLPSKLEENISTQPDWTLILLGGSTVSDLECLLRSISEKVNKLWHKI
jgi:hypothetical protein